MRWPSRFVADRGGGGGRWRRVELWVPLLVVAVDQLTKWLVRTRVPLHSSVEIIPDFLDITHVRNTGAAFGFLNAVEFPGKSIVIAIVAICALIGISIYAGTLSSEQVLPRLAMALIIGGAAGNLVDRMFVGSVVDFVDAYWGSFHFWAFNVADSAITVGVALMILDMIGTGTHASNPV
jgi:signal peptidase II